MPCQFRFVSGDLRQQRLLLLTLLGIAVQLLLRFPLLACALLRA
jgi:hypothetical protein